jgi:hypothetical protein
MSSSLAKPPSARCWRGRYRTGGRSRFRNRDLIPSMSSSEFTCLVNCLIAYLQGPRADGTTSIQVALPRPVIPTHWKLVHDPSAHAAGSCRLVGAFPKGPASPYWPSSCLRQAGPPGSLSRGGPRGWVASKCAVLQAGEPMNSNSLTELAARINEAYEALVSAQKGTLEYAIKTGELLQ